MKKRNGKFVLDPYNNAVHLYSSMENETHFVKDSVKFNCITYDYI